MSFITDCVEVYKNPKDKRAAYVFLKAAGIVYGSAATTNLLYSFITNSMHVGTLVYFGVNGLIGYECLVIGNNVKQMIEEKGTLWGDIKMAVSPVWEMLFKDTLVCYAIYNKIKNMVRR